MYQTDCFYFKQNYGILPFFHFENNNVSQANFFFFTHLAKIILFTPIFVSIITSVTV